MASRKKNKRRKKKKGNFISKLFVFVMLLGVIGICTVRYGEKYINEKISLMNIEQLDKSELAMSEDIYKDITDGTKVVALFGTDERIQDHSMGVRADTIMVCSVDTVNHNINIISIPRDTYVYIDGHGNTKINHAFSYGREQLAVKTINKNFNLAIDEYVTIDFSGLINIVNAVGGVDLEITEAERKFINTRLDESYTLTGKTKEEVTESGLVHLNGEQTLAHVRNRTVGSDFERTRRQRDAISAIVSSVGKLKIKEVIDLVDISLKQVKTNVNAWDYIKLVPNFIKNIESYKQNINALQLPSIENSTEKYINGTYYFVPNKQTAIADFKKHVYGIE